MSEKRPLVLGDTGVEQLQPGDCLEDTVSPAQFNKLRHQFRSLLAFLQQEGIELPEDLVEDFHLED